MKIENRTNIIIAVIAVFSSLLGAVGGSWVTGDFLIEATKAQTKKDIRILSAQNAQKTVEGIKSRAEDFLKKFHELNTLLETNDSFEIKKAQMMVNELEGKAYNLLAYAGPGVGGKSLQLCIKYEQAITVSSAEDRKIALAGLVESSTEWYLAYFKEISKYESQTMPEKWKIDLLGPMFSHLLNLGDT